MANYHPSDELLMEFTAGQKHDPLGIMVACHLESCRECQQRIQMFEQLGGELLQETDPQPVSKDLLETLLSRLNEPAKAEAKYNGDPRIPRPLQRFVTSFYDGLPWKGFTKNIKEFTLPFSNKQYVAKFYKIAAGKQLPVHTHRGNEYTLVMSGKFSDDAGDYQQGDFILADTNTHHQPRAGMEEDCICFAVMDAPLKFTGLFGRLLNPFMR
ncbi:ChrR family anti-sigma-E factor [Oceaniserpentilla sp. 4NH20-0058]|uniref:ChrR family anti-sigma-E factor n=1 Tax=Oceaniserpentilla sp. 4NH20-0058 TaxID=3127660 RepID=UPI0031044802